MCIVKVCQILHVAFQDISDTGVCLNTVEIEVQNFVVVEKSEIADGQRLRLGSCVGAYSELASR